MGVTVNQLAPEEAVKLVPEVPPTLMVWVAGAVPPKVCEKETEEGVAVIEPVPLLPDTVSVTGTVTVVPPPVMVTLVWYVAAFNPDALTERVRVAGVVPDVGVTVNQLAPEEAVKLVPEVPPTLMVCVAGAVPPKVCEKETEEGVAVIEPGLPVPPVTV